MTVYTEAELAYLQGERRLAHVATVGKDGTPHVTPVGMWSIDPGSGVVEVTGHSFAATKKFRDVARSGRAAIVVDDVLPPWRPRGVEVRGHAEAIARNVQPRAHRNHGRIDGHSAPADGRSAGRRPREGVGGRDDCQGVHAAGG